MRPSFILSLILAATLSVKNAPADEMAMSKPAQSSLSECNEMNAGEIVMMSSCLMPFGVMTGEAGKWMVGYQFMHEKMDGSLVGTDDISISQILKQFPSAPTDMTMDMHMGDDDVRAHPKAHAKRDGSLRHKGNEQCQC
jgi:hypothetical protein